MLAAKCYQIKSKDKLIYAGEAAGGKLVSYKHIHDSRTIACVGHINICLPEPATRETEDRITTNCDTGPIEN